MRRRHVIENSGSTVLWYWIYWSR